MKLIFLTKAGSHLYGLNTPESDVDLRGVCLDKMDALLGLKKFEQWQPNKEQALSFSSTFNLVSDDITIYGLKKFVLLLLENNPNIVELLFAKDILVTHSYTKIWDSLLAQKQYILSTKLAHTFAGYAYSQLHRIRGHKRWIDSPPAKPSPEEYGMVLTEKGGQKWTDSNKYNQYQSLIKDYNAYETWLKERNPKRKDLEIKYGYDTKHAMHLYRLLMEAQELLLTGNLELPLSGFQRTYLLAIKNGGMSYTDLLSNAESAIDSLKTIQSSLPKSPNFEEMNDWLIWIYRQYIIGK